MDDTEPLDEASWENGDRGGDRGELENCGGAAKAGDTGVPEHGSSGMVNRSGED